jgi:hypothetical protein
MIDLPPLYRLLPPELALLTVLDQPALVAELFDRVQRDRVLALSCQHRLSGQLASSLQAATVERSFVLDGLEAVLPERDGRQAEFDDAIAPQLEEVCSALLSAGVEPTLLKGAALVCGGWLRAGERPMADLDLLIDRACLDSASHVMYDLGYRTRVSTDDRRWARLHHYQDPAWYHEDRPVGVEIHWGILEPRHRLAFDPGTLATTEVTLAGGTRVRRLEERDLLTHLCLHFWRDRADGLPGSLGQLWDIRHVAARARAPLWTDLFTIADERGHGEVLDAVLACSFLLLGAPPAETHPRIATTAARELTRSFAIRRVLAPRPEALQLLMVTGDVEYNPLRVVNRVAAQLARPVSQLRASYGDAPQWRLRLIHASRLARLIIGLARTPSDTLSDIRLDRWAHRLR